jgi:hypothetical protein
MRALLRRALAVIIVGALLLLAALPAIVGKSHTPDHQGATTAGTRGPLLALAIGAESLAALVFALNLWLAFIRIPLRRALGRYREGEGRVSGLPGISALLACTASILGVGTPAIGWVSLAIVSLDPWGPVAFLLCTWRDRDLWKGTDSRTPTTR